MTHPDEEGFSTSVALVNVRIGFWRLVTLFIKFFLAAVPAMIIFYFIMGLILASIFGILTTLGYRPEQLRPWVMEQWRIQGGAQGGGEQR